MCQGAEATQARAVAREAHARACGKARRPGTRRTAGRAGSRRSAGPRRSAGTRWRCRRGARVRRGERVRGSRQRSVALGDLLGPTRLTGRNDHRRKLPLHLHARPGAVQDLLRGRGDLQTSRATRWSIPRLLIYKQDYSARLRSHHLLRVRGRRQQQRGACPDISRADVGGRRRRDADASEHGDRRVARLWQHASRSAGRGGGRRSGCQPHPPRYRLLRRRGNVRVRAARPSRARRARPASTCLGWSGGTSSRPSRLAGSKTSQ